MSCDLIRQLSQVLRYPLFILGNDLGQITFPDFFIQLRDHGNAGFPPPLLKLTVHFKQFRLIHERFFCAEPESLMHHL